MQASVLDIGALVIHQLERSLTGDGMRKGSGAVGSRRIRLADFFNSVGDQFIVVIKAYTEEICILCGIHISYRRIQFRLRYAGFVLFVEGYRNFMLLSDIPLSGKCRCHLPLTGTVRNHRRGRKQVFCEVAVLRPADGIFVVSDNRRIGAGDRRQKIIRAGHHLCGNRFTAGIIVRCCPEALLSVMIDQFMEYDRFRKTGAVSDSMKRIIGLPVPHHFDQQPVVRRNLGHCGSVRFPELGFDFEIGNLRKRNCAGAVFTCR